MARPTDQLAVRTVPAVVGTRRPARVPAAGRLASLSVVVPVHDEESNLPGVAEAVLAVLPAVAHRWELLIVDDGSRDGTAAIADRLARSRPGVRVVRHERNRGYGAALASGIAAARHDYVFLMDGDGQFDPAQLARLLVPLAHADAVVGYRARRADAWLRRVNTTGWNLLVRRVFGLSVRDVNCAFKLVRRALLAGVAVEARGAMISTELLVRIRQRGGRIAEVPVDHFPRRAGRPSGAAPRVIVRAFVELARLASRLRRPLPR